MRHNDQQYGIPETIYKDTKANVEALSGCVEGMIAYATDTDRRGVYNGAAWDWEIRETFLTSPLTSTSWDGDARSSTGKTVIDLSSVFSVPAGVKAILARLYGRDSGSATSTSVYFGLSPNNTGASIALAIRPTGVYADAPVENTGWCPCNSDGDVYFQCAASGTGTLDIWIEIWGYCL